MTAAPGRPVKRTVHRDPARLVGAWRLVSWEIRHADGRITRPFGRRPQGLLLYTPDGGMSANIAARARRPLSAVIPREAPIAERARAFDSFFAYAGRFSVHGTQLRHDVAVSLGPAMRGTRQLREFRFTRGRLELSATERAGRTGERRHILLWARLPASRSGARRGQPGEGAA